MNLEEEIADLEKLHTKDAMMKRNDLSNQVSEAVRVLRNKFLIKKHGSQSLVEGGEVPLKYNLGDSSKNYEGAYQDAVDLVDYIVENIFTSYCSPMFKDKEKFKEWKKTTPHAKQHMRWTVSHELNLNLEHLQEDLYNKKVDINKSEVLNETIARAGLIFTSHDIQDKYQNILRQDKLADVKKYLGKELEKKGYGYKDLEGALPKDVEDLLGYHVGKAIEAAAEKPGSKLYKKDKK